MRDVYSGFVVRFGGQREFSLFNSHKNDSLKSSQQLANVQIVGVELVPYIVDIKKKREVWQQQRRGNSFSKCANAEPSCIKLRLELCQASIWGQIFESWQNHSHPCIHLGCMKSLLPVPFLVNFIKATNAAIDIGINIHCDVFMIRR